MVNDQDMKNELLIGTAVLGVVAVAAAAWAFARHSRPPSVEQMTQTSLQQSVPLRNAYYNGDYNGPIADLPALIANAPTRSERARLQLLLASSLLARNQGDDLVQGVSLIKKIVNDYSVDPWIRAVALSDLARIVPGNSVAFYAQNLTDDPFSTYLPSTGSDTQKLDTAALKILQLADDTFPNSATEYLTLGSYYLPALEGGWIASTDLASTAKTMQTYVMEGDFRNDQNLFSPSTVLFGLTYRARALWQTALILKNKTLDEQEVAFKNIFSTADAYQKSGTNMDGPIVAAAVLRARFWYADFMLNNGGHSRAGEIEAILRPFGSASPSNSYVRLFATADTVTFDKRKTEAIKLAAISPEFKSYMVAMGIHLP